VGPNQAVVLKHCGRDQTAGADALKLVLEQVDAALLNECHADQRVVGAVEHAPHGSEWLVEHLQTDR